MRTIPTAVLVLALAVVVAAPAWAGDPGDPRPAAPARSASTAATGTISGFGLPVTCDMPLQHTTYDQAWGLYHGDAAVPSIQLRPFVCGYLAQAERGIVTRSSAGAVFVLSHELAHSIGIQNEIGADCVAGSRLKWVAAKLRIPYAARYGLWVQTAEIREQSCAAWAEAGNPWAP
jgi:hypothetical protein